MNDARQEVVSSFVPSILPEHLPVSRPSLPSDHTVLFDSCPLPPRLLLVHLALTDELVSATAPLLAVTCTGGSHPCFTRTVTFQEMLMRDFFFLLAGPLMTTQMIASSLLLTGKKKGTGRGEERICNSDVAANFRVVPRLFWQLASRQPLHPLNLGS